MWPLLVPSLHRQSGTSQGICPRDPGREAVDLDPAEPKRGRKAWAFFQLVETNCQRNNMELAPNMAYCHEAGRGHLAKGHPRIGSWAGCGPGRPKVRITVHQTS